MSCQHPYRAGANDNDAAINGDVVFGQSLEVYFGSVIRVDQIPFGRAPRRVSQVREMLHRRRPGFWRDLKQ